MASIAYWRGPNIPAAILTSAELEEVTRLQARRFYIPYALLFILAAVSFLSIKGQLPLSATLIFGAAAVCVCIFTEITSQRSIRNILARAPAEANLPEHGSLSSRFRATWQGIENWQLTLITWYFGAVAFSSVFAVLSKITGRGGFDPDDQYHPVVLLLALIASSFVFYLCLKERRRRRAAQARL